ncbi:MAG: 6-phosphogluconate dehydrogenase [Bacteriovoracaceae bacterium]
MKTKLILILTGILTLTALILFGLSKYSYSKGVRSGKLVKISKKGMVFKTYEGTLDLGSGDMLTWNFSVHSKDLGEALVKVSGEPVKLYYQERLFKLFWETKYDVDEFKLLKPEGVNDERFCKLVNLLRKNHHVVNAVKEMIKRSEPEFLSQLKNCQQ